MRHPYQHRHLESLEIYELQGQKSEYYVVLLHGFGATPLDLFPIQEESTFQGGWIFPQGPLNISYGPDYTGHAWFKVDFDHLERASKDKNFRSLATNTPPGMIAATQQVMQALEELQIPASRLIIGGFSQGAMVATEVALQLQERVAGLLVLSGTLIDEERWKVLAQKKKGLRLFISHGTHDHLLPFHEAKQMAHIMQEAGWQVDFVEFPGEHTIPASVLSRLDQFLGRI